MAELKFYIGNVLDQLKDPADGTSYKISAVRIEEADYYDGTYTPIDTVRITPDDTFVWTRNGSAEFLDKWYQLVFVGKDSNGNDVDRGKTNPVVPEFVAQLVDSIRAFFQDTNLENPAWEDKEYIAAIRFAAKQYKGEKNLTYVREEDLIPIQLLVRIEFALIIAYDHAKYYALQAPSATLDKSQIQAHYLDVARNIEDHYNNLTRRLGMGSDGVGIDDNGVQTQYPAPNIVAMKRFSYTAGIYTSSIEPTAKTRTTFFSDPIP